MQKNKTGMRAAWLIILCAALAVLIGSLISRQCESFGIDKYFARIIGQLPMVVPVLAGVIYVRHGYGREYALEAMGYKWFHPAAVFFLLILPVCSRYFALFVESGCRAFTEESFAVAAKTIPKDLYGMLMLFLSNCIIAPVLEETVFRGAVFKAAEPYGSFSAVAVAALGFTLVHFEMTAVVRLLMWGTVLGLIRVWTGSVVACMLFHSVLNFESFLHRIFVSDLCYVIDFLMEYATVMTYLFPLLLLITYFCFGRRKSFKKTVKSGTGGMLLMLLTISLFGGILYMKGL